VSVSGVKMNNWGDQKLISTLIFTFLSILGAVYVYRIHLYLFIGYCILILTSIAYKVYIRLSTRGNDDQNNDSDVK